MNEKYQSLSWLRKRQLVRQGCLADDWSNVKVTDSFNPDDVHNSTFHGKVNLGKCKISFSVLTDVEVGEDSVIEQSTLKSVILGNEVTISRVGLIENYRIEKNVSIVRVNELRSDENFGELWTKGFAVGNEAGDDNICFSLMTDDSTAWNSVHTRNRKLYKKLQSAEHPTEAIIASATTIDNAGFLLNIVTAYGVTIQGAAELHHGYIGQCCYVGSQVIAHYFLTHERSKIDGGANLHHVIVGAYSKIGKGFTAENCYFSHHCELYCGEACAIFAGPHTVSHHKSTLLIGGEFSFYNAGSGTNQSNHAYKMGPIHHGKLARGSKTASGSHILWPMQTAPFTMVMGKVKSHPDLSKLPFSYVIAEQEKVYTIPGINLTTVGTFRDVMKWRERGQSDFIGEYDFLSPYVMQAVFEGLSLLNELQEKYGKEAKEYPYNGTVIRNSSLLKGIERYKMAIKLFACKIDFDDESLIPDTKTAVWRWTDLNGIPIIEERDQGYSVLPKAPGTIKKFNRNYQRQTQMWGKMKLATYYGESFDANTLKEEATQCFAEWKKCLVDDAQKEFAMGDVEESLLTKTIARIESIRAEEIL